MNKSTGCYSQYMKPKKNQTPQRERPVNVGTIGHVDHGTSTLAPPLTYSIKSKIDMLEWIEFKMIESLKQ